MSLLTPADIMSDDLVIDVSYAGIATPIKAIVQENAEQGDQGRGGAPFRPGLGKYVTIWLSMDDVPDPAQGDKFTARNIEYTVRQATPVHEAGMWEIFGSSNIKRVAQ